MPPPATVRCQCRTPHAEPRTLGCRSSWVIGVLCPALEPPVDRAFSPLSFTRRSAPESRTTSGRFGTRRSRTRRIDSRGRSACSHSRRRRDDQVDDFVPRQSLMISVYTHRIGVNLPGQSVVSCGTPPRRGVRFPLGPASEPARAACRRASFACCIAPPHPLHHRRDCRRLQAAGIVLTTPTRPLRSGPHGAKEATRGITAKVLVVDDEPTWRRWHALRRKGYEYHVRRRRMQSTSQPTGGSTSRCGNDAPRANGFRSRRRSRTPPRAGAVYGVGELVTRAPGLRLRQWCGWFLANHLALGKWPTSSSHFARSGRLEGDPVSGGAA